MADELPKKDFKDRYGKEKGDAVRYATTTNMIKKKLNIDEDKTPQERITDLQTRINDKQQKINDIRELTLNKRHLLQSQNLI